MRQPLFLAQCAAASLSNPPASVLLTSETGIGKELVACTIHAASPCRDQPFIAVNCAGIPDTLLESELFGYKTGAFTGADNKAFARSYYASTGQRL